MISEKVKCRSLTEAVGRKSRGDDFVGMDIMISLTSSRVIRGRVLND